MIHTVLEVPEKFTWLDIVAPTREELAKISKLYGLPPHAAQDSLQPEHLPKFEKIPEGSFLILRSYDVACSVSSDEVLELTRKIAVFWGENFLVTIHRKDAPFLEELRIRSKGFSQMESAELRNLLLWELVHGVVFSYERPISEAQIQRESFEVKVLKKKRRVGTDLLIRESYVLKRKVSVYRRMLRAVQELLPRAIYQPNHLQDLRDETDRLLYYCDELLESVNTLIALQLSIASHRTNEVMRILTVFSVFFLPLNFIAGIYGMNFSYMPELHNRWGYPLVLGLMLLVSGLIFRWFKKSGFLR